MHQSRATRNMVECRKPGRLVVGGDREAGGRHRDPADVERQPDQCEIARQLEIGRVSEPDPQQGRRDQERHQPHVGIGRSEHDPRQDQEHDEQDDRGKSEVARQRQLGPPPGEDQHGQRNRHRRHVEPLPAIAQGHRQPHQFGREVEPVLGHPLADPASPQQDQQQRPGHDCGMHACAQGRSPPTDPAIMLAHRFGRKCQQAERPPTERVGDEDHERDRHEQQGAKPGPPLPPEPEPQPEGEERERHRQRIIDEAEQERVAERERKREQGGRRQAVMNLARDPQEAGHGQRRDRHDDQFDRQLEPENFLQRHDQQIDPEIAD